jgi:hypothetical protein
LERAHRAAERKYAASHRAELAARAAAYRAANPEQHLVAVKRWNANNPERRRLAFHLWRKRPGNDIGCSLRKTLWQALKHRDSGRDWRSDCKLRGIIGCSKGDLVAHLGSQFVSGMSWGNYGRGGWEIDHIKPCADFDLTQHNQVLDCFHYTNLRPLWCAHNQRKSKRSA